MLSRGPETVFIGPMLVVAAAMIDGDGRVLVAQRPPGKQLAGLWEFPGGKVEPGETPEGALVRELAEELGIEAVEGNLIPAGFASEPRDGRHLVLLLYTLRRWAGVPESLDASAIRWVPVGELRELAMPPADVALIGALERELKKRI